MSVQDKLQMFLDQGAVGAYSGASKTLELLFSEGKPHLISRYYQYASSCGDNGKVRGIVDILHEIDRSDLLEEVPTLYTETNATLRNPVVVEGQESVELFLDLKAGDYKVMLVMDIINPKDYSEHFNVYVYDKSGNIIKAADGYVYDEAMTFTVGEWESGVCKIDIWTYQGKGTIQKVLVEQWKYKSSR
ncbi:hypothetical protein ACFVS2_20500 [Brevibacillus sp. NPDC058079]|uniref:hypothetical protein n=1 Tax=Brevibacillus sp. NPDC058079 TaxID=3346330 RepID=UPI0036E74EDA